MSRSATSSRRFALSVALVVVSAGGLLAAGGIGLWRAARDARALADAAAGQALVAALRAVQGWLADPERLDGGAASGDPRAFRVTEGRVEPLLPGARWRLDPAAPELDLPAHHLPLLDALDALGPPADGAREPAGEVQQQLVASLDGDVALAARQRAFLLHAAARAARRCADEPILAARTDALLATLAPDANPPHFASVVAGALLLAVERGAPLDAFEPLDALLAALPPATAPALVERARELADPATNDTPPAAARAAALAVAHARVDAHRRTAAALEPHLVRLAAATEPLALPVGRELLLYRPATGGGLGALRPVEAWLPATGLPDGSWRLDDPRVAPGGAVRLHLGEPPPAGALALAPGLHLAPLAVPAPSRLGSVGGLAALLCTLGAVLLGTLLLVLRTVRRDAAATAARARFLAAVTHELKTPLASIRLLTEMLAEGRTPPEKQEQYHRLLAGEAERLSALIENVLDAGELARGERALDLAPQPVDELLRDVAARVAPLVERDGLRLELALPATPLAAPVDRGAFAQIVLNLIDNARKYARAGGRIDVELAAAGGTALALRVRDHGPGIAAAERTSLFEPFVRGARQADGAIPGLGLGLHLARSLARRHGGELACVEPRDGGGGACFELTLPRSNGVAR